MNYLNRFKQLSDEAAEALQNLVKDMVNKNTTNTPLFYIYKDGSVKKQIILD